MSGEVCSARIETLQGFARAGLDGRAQANVTGRVAAVTRDWDAMVAACAFRAVEGNPGPELAITMDQFRANEDWVDGIATALEQAPVASGISARSSAEMAAALAAGGTVPDAGAVAFDPQEIVGSPVTSGMVNDPVNAANGNFVHAERDLAFPGFAAVLDLVRVYNSFNTARTGCFGRGWTSTLDVALDLGAVAAGQVGLAFTDGAVVTFHAAPGADPDTPWPPNIRRRLQLRPAGDGWEVWRHNGRRRWYFDADGALTGGSEGAARYTVARHGDRSIRCTEAQSGRWIHYDLAGGLVVAVTTSDGRAGAYHYDQDGHCLGAERAIGDMTYRQSDTGQLAAVVDADGVALVRNRYDERGRVTAQVSPHGRRTTLDYLDHGATRVTDDDGEGPSNLLFHDATGNLVALFGADGAAMRASYDPQGRVVRHVDRAGAVTLYQYHPDPALDLITRRTDPDGQAEERHYDEQGRLLEHLDRAGAEYRYHYDGERPHPSLIQAPEGVELTTAYDHRDLPVTVTDGDGVITRFEWDESGQLTAHIDGAGHRTTFAYDPAGQLRAVTDPAGHTASFRLDRAGRVATATDGAGDARSYRYTPAGRVLAMTTAGPGSWQAAYGPHGALAAFTDAVGATVHFDHDASGHITGVTAPDGARTTQEWDGLGLLRAVTDPAGSTATQTLDRAGRPVSVTRYDGSTFSREVDALGRTVTVVGPDGARTVRTYHPGGQLASVTDPSGARWTFEVDGLGRLVAEVDPGGGRTTFGYSPGSRLVRQVSAAGRIWAYGHDGAGRPMSVTDPDGVTTSVTLGPDGRTTAVTVGDRRVDLTFDGAGRVASWADGATGRHLDFDWTADALTLTTGDDDPTRFELDPRALLAQVTDPSRILTRLEHDIRGRLTGAVTGEGTTTVRYDAAGAVTATVDADGLLTTRRTSAAGRLEQLVFGPSGLGRAFTYDQAGRVVAVASLDGAPLTSLGWDPAGRLRQAGVGGAATTLERDGRGLVVAVADATGTVARYERDPDGLVLARSEGDGGRSDGFRTSYVRSPAGRITGFVDSDAGEVNLPPADNGPVARDRAGRIVVDGHGRSYRYDRSGRLEQATAPDGTLRRFTWNDLGLLATDQVGAIRRRYRYTIGGQLSEVVTSPASGPAVTTTATFSYDAAGRRIGRTGSDGTATRYRWNDLDQLLAVERVDPAGHVTARHFTWNGLGQVSSVDGLAIGWDDAVTGKPVRIGDTRYLRSGLLVRPATADGAWTDGTDDDPWGPAPGLAPSVTLGFRGELCVDGLVVMGDRIYDPDTRAFLSRDPLPPRAGANGAFGSAYAYAWCDPVNHVDPTGRQPVSIEEFNTWKERQESNRFERAGQAIVEDPWGSLAMVGVMAVGVGLMATGVGGPIGAGILIGAAASATTGLATDHFNPRAVALGGAFGAIPGANTVGGAFAAGFSQNLTSQVLIDGRGLGQLDYGTALLDGTIGAAIPGVGNGIRRILPTGTIDDLTPPPRPGNLAGDAPPPDFSRLVPGGGLSAHEVVGGHTLARHIGLPESDLAARLAAQPGIPAASTFGDRAVAETSIAAALDAEGTAIQSWLASGGGNAGSAFTHTVADPVGITLVRGAPGAVPASTVRVVLRPFPSMPDGYRILTSYPEP